MQDGVDLNDKSGHNNDGSECEAEKSETMWLAVHRHDRKAGNQSDDANDHPLIILATKRKFIHDYFIYKFESLIKLIKRHLQVFSNREESANDRYNHSDEQERCQ